jgi:hypothetical protein
MHIPIETTLWQSYDGRDHLVHAPIHVHHVSREQGQKCLTLGLGHWLSEHTLEVIESIRIQLLLCVHQPLMLDEDLLCLHHGVSQSWFDFYVKCVLCLGEPTTDALALHSIGCAFRMGDINGPKQVPWSLQLSPMGCRHWVCSIDAIIMVGFPSKGGVEPLRRINTSSQKPRSSWRSSSGLIGLSKVVLPHLAYGNY